MPSFQTLIVDNLRVLRRVDIRLASRFNLIAGPNASGKTSLLEALYILSRGRSFREKNWRAIVSEGCSNVRIVTRLRRGDQEIPVGVQHDSQHLTIRVDGESLRSSRSLVEKVPLLLIHPDSHRLVDQGPAYRRQYLDWGVFHVEHRFVSEWQRFRRALRQRNAALRGSYSEAVMKPWEQEIANTAIEIDLYRKRYVEQLGEFVKEHGKLLLDTDELELRYYRGWREDDLADYLRASRGTDRQQGYTRHGPHRADLELTISGKKAVQRVSRGQQKALIFVLVLAQARLMGVVSGHHPILLVDDLSAELDMAHLERIWLSLGSIGSQVFVTGTDIDAKVTLNSYSDSMFHVKHGVVSGVV